MMIEIQCGNFSNFDPALGRYIECGEKIIVSGEEVGQLVTCTRCSQPIEVPHGIGASGEDSINDPSSATQRSGSGSAQRSNQRKTRAGKSKSAGPRTRKGKSSRVSSAENGAGNGKPKPGSTATRATKNKSVSGNRALVKQKKHQSSTMVIQKTDLMSMNFGGEFAAMTLGEDRMERCKKCGNIVDNGQCTVCKYIEPKFDKLHQPLHEIEIELAGFQRWCCQTMNEGVSVRVIEYAAHGMLLFLAVFLLVVAVFGCLGFGIGPLGGTLLLIADCMAVMFYIGIIYKGHQFLRNPNAQLAWFQKPFWNLMLRVSRMMKWEGYDSGLKDRRVIKVRERLFRDHEILDLEGIKTCQVLDLQGTGVTDRGLLDLYGLTHLRCVILKRTKVTHEAVFRLQQSFPRLWIWY